MQQREILHHLLEWTAFLFAATTFGIVSQTPAGDRDVGTAFIVGGFLASGLLDGLHAVQSLGLAPAASNAMNWCAISWTLSRSVFLFATMAGLSLGVFLKGRIVPGQWRWWTGTAAGCAGLVVLGMFLSRQPLPRVVFASAIVSHPWDIIPLGLAAVTLAAVRAGWWRTSLTGFQRGVLLGFMPLTAAQLLLTFGAKEGIDFSFLTAHALKVMAVALALVGVAADYRRTLIGTSRLSERLRQGEIDLATEQRAAREQIQQSERRFRGVFEASIDAFFLLDMKTYAILDANPRACELLGYTMDELLHMTARDVHPHEMARLIEFSRIAAEHGGARTAELSCFTKTGRLVPVEVSATFFSDHAGRSVIAAQVRDMTLAFKAREEKARLEQELNHAERINSLGRLASGIAHDFNNLLTVMLAGGQEIAHSPESSADARATAQMIHTAAKQAAEMTGQLLAFSRRQPHAPVRLDIAAAVRQMEPLLKRVLPSDITLTLQLASAPVWAQVDPVQWDQVIMNLCVNARDAMPGGGTLTLTVRTELPENGTAGGWAVLNVRDTGTGIAPDSLDRIFEPFFTTKERGRGTGLGLATVYGIVQQHAGRIVVDSKVGGGSTFTVRLPALPPGEDDPGQADTDMAPPAAATVGDFVVFVVEDDPLVREAVVAAARRHARQVADFPNAREALAAIEERAGAVDLVITDVVMPGMDGVSLLHEVRRRWPRIRHMVVTGYSPDPLTRGSENNFVVLGKPFTRESFAAAFQRAVVAGPVARLG